MFAYATAHISRPTWASETATSGSHHLHAISIISSIFSKLAISQSRLLESPFNRINPGAYYNIKITSQPNYTDYLFGIYD